MANIGPLPRDLDSYRHVSETVDRLNEWRIGVKKNRWFKENTFDETPPYNPSGMRGTATVVPKPQRD